MQRLPPVNLQCPPLKSDEAPLLIVGIHNGDVLKRLPGLGSLDLRITTQGGSGGPQWWFLNGEQVMTTENNQGLVQTLTQPGKYQLSVLDLGGQVDSVNFTLK